MSISKEEKVKSRIEPKDVEKIKNPGSAEKKKKKRTLLIVMVIVVLIVLALFLSVIFAITQRGSNTIVKGISANGIELSNLTVASAKQKIAEKVNAQTKTPIKLKYNDYTLDLNLSEFEFTYDIEGTVKEAYEIGRGDNIVKSNYEILSTMVKGKNVDLKYKYNKEALKKIIENMDSAIPGRTEEYTYCIEEEELIITPGKDGIAVNKESLEKLIIDTILKRDDSIATKQFQELTIPVANKKASPIDIDKIYQEVYCEPKDAVLVEEPFSLTKDEDGIDFAISIEEAKALITGDKEEYSIPLKITKANQTVADLGAKAFPQVLSEFQTNYNPGAVARTKNLQIAAGKIDGTVVMPGEEFSFNKVVGKRTVQDGYQNAPVYENGKVVDGLAGGICQISTTLYNAALLANLEITDRRNHNFVSTYVSEGRDATVVYGSQDLKFKNTRQYPIQINCSVSGGVAYFVIKGIKEDPEYQVKIITNVTATIPFDEQIEEDPSLEPGTKQVVQAGHNGAKVTSYRVLYLNGEEVSRTLLYNDTYRTMSRIVKVGAGTEEAQEENPNVPEDLGSIQTNQEEQQNNQNAVDEQKAAEEAAAKKAAEEAAAQKAAEEAAAQKAAEEAAKEAAKKAEEEAKKKAEEEAEKQNPPAEDTTPTEDDTSAQTIDNNEEATP